MKFTPYLLCLLLWVVSGFAVRAQEVKIEIGKTDIAINEMFQVSVVVSNDKLSEFSGFPEIQGFYKAGTSRGNSTNIINGNIFTSESVTQNYKADKEGTYSLKPFSMKINGKVVRFNGATIKVSNKKSVDPFESLWNMGEQEDAREFIDVKEDAFFAITTNKNEVFLGEGFNLTIAFYIAEQNRAYLEFHEVGEQLAEILKKIKPSHCWEENFGIEEIVPETVSIKGKAYRQYKIYQANFYPFNQQPITIPAVPFKMIKLKISATPSWFGRDHIRDFKTFSSKEKTITVKPLPPHPLRDQVAVGNYRLEEMSDQDSLLTGQSFNYRFQIVGEGNISAIRKPALPAQIPGFDIYEPNEKSQINHGEGTVFGFKQFNYMMIPTEPGRYQLGDYFSWIYFNTKTAAYDTLRSGMMLNVTGESKSGLSSNAQNLFYDSMDEVSNELIDLHRDELLKLLANIAIGMLLAATVFIVVKRTKKEKK